MADITIDDLLHWERGLTFRPADGQPEATALGRTISWAVTIRVSTPVLPVLRGGEIVIVPSRILERVEEAEMIDRGGVLRMLAEQPVAALLVDRSFDVAAAANIPLLISDGPFLHDAESVLNRLLTERRAELYRLGSDLSRALSTAAMASAGLDAVLNAAEEAGGRPIVVQSDAGAIIASSRGASHLMLPAAPAPIGPLAGQVKLTSRATGDPWLVQPVRSPGGTVFLSIALLPDVSSEAERLILAQTANVVELVLNDAGQGGRPGRERQNRQALVADLLLGRIVSREAAETRLRLLGIEPAQAVRVALFSSREPGLASRMGTTIRGDLARYGVPLDDFAYAVIIGEPTVERDWRELAGTLRTVRAHDPSAVLVLSEPVASAANSPVAVQQARVVARLLHDGILDGSSLRADEIDHAGVFALLIPLVTGVDADPVAYRRRLRRIAGSLLAPLEEHDRRRGGELASTLATHLRLGGALTQAAQDLNIHRNTLSYRLARIEDLTNRDLSDPKTRFLFRLALSIRALERALEPVEDDGSADGTMISRGDVGPDSGRR